MSMKALADDLNEATRLYNQGKIDYLHYVDLCQFHQACYERKENE